MIDFTNLTNVLQLFADKVKRSILGMRKVAWFLTEEYEQTNGVIDVKDGLTDEEVNDILFDIIAENVHGSKWMVEWEYVTE